MNKWFDTYVIPQMKEKYDIKVKRVGMNIDDIMNKLLSEKQAKSKDGVMDVVWINGENFKLQKRIIYYLDHSQKNFLTLMIT